MQILAIVLVVIMVMWTLFWKGYSLWTSARIGHRRWFMALLVLNTMGVLDIIYLHFVAKKTFRDIFRVFKTRI